MIWILTLHKVTFTISIPRIVGPIYQRIHVKMLNVEIFKLAVTSNMHAIRKRHHSHLFRINFKPVLCIWKSTVLGGILGQVFTHWAKVHTVHATQSIMFVWLSSCVVNLAIHFRRTIEGAFWDPVREKEEWISRHSLLPDYRRPHQKYGTKSNTSKNIPTNGNGYARERRIYWYCSQRWNLLRSCRRMSSRSQSALQARRFYWGRHWGKY